MKILTVNTHSYIEKDYEKKLKIFVNEIRHELPDIIAMQEVNQISDNKTVTSELLICEHGITLKEENHALKAARMLDDYRFVWCGIKNGYEIFDEGLAFLVRKDLDTTDAFYLSRTTDIKNWKTRMALGIRIGEDWFYNVHMGRWDDEEEDFKSQWDMLQKKIRHGKTTWIMGDFNAPSSVKNEGYSLITDSGWFDTYTLAQEKDEGFTVGGRIDGWNDKESEPMRIDYIFTDKKVDILNSEVIFKDEKIISDHYGVKIISA